MRKAQTNNRLQHIILQYMLLFLIITCLYLFCRMTGWNARIRVIQSGMAVLLLADALAAVWLWRNNRKQELYKAVFFAGFVMRIGYMLYTGCNVRSHDLWDFRTDDCGHAGYLLTIFETHQLPTSNYRQYYQQPLFYLLGCLVSGSVNSVLSCNEPYYLVDATKIISCFASCATLWPIKPLCEICKVGRKGLLTACSIVAFLPAFYLTGGRVSCDALVALWMTLALLYTLRWHEMPSWKNTILLAVIYGCGMMTKISCGVLAVLTAAVFVCKLWNALRAKTLGSLLPKYFVFGAISLPLGLWYSVRNYRLFGQPLGYVLQLSSESPLYTGDISLFRRLLFPDFHSLLQTPYASPTEDYSLPTYIVKSALFGEFSFSIPHIIPTLLLAAGVALTGLLMLAVIWQFRCNCGDQYGLWMAIAFLWYYGSLLLFYVRYPFGCSMDFRYMLFLVIPCSILLAKCYEASENNRIRRLTQQVLACYGALSCLMYLCIAV